MDDIVLWGMGKYGRSILKMIQLYWKERYNIIALADSDYIRINNEQYGGKDIVIGLEACKELYKNGSISGVLITVNFVTIYNEIYKMINAAGIPVIEMKDDYISASSICKNAYNIYNDAYRVDVVDNIWAVP